MTSEAQRVGNQPHSFGPETSTGGERTVTTTIHLTDAQCDTFAACGLIVIDGEPQSMDVHGAAHLAESTRLHGTACNRGSGRIVADWWGVNCVTCKSTEFYAERRAKRDRPLVAPEGWRILTEPCDTCNGSGADFSIEFDRPPNFDPCLNPDCVGGLRVVTLTATCPDWHCTKDWRCGCGLGVRHVVDCGRPVPPCPSKCERGVVTLGRFTIPALLPVTGDNRGNDWPGPHVETIGDSAFMWLSTDSGDCHELALSTLHLRPGQFIARPERVA